MFNRHRASQLNIVAATESVPLFIKHPVAHHLQIGLFSVLRFKPALPWVDAGSSLAAGLVMLCAEAQHVHVRAWCGSSVDVVDADVVVCDAVNPAGHAPNYANQAGPVELFPARRITHAASGMRSAMCSIAAPSRSCQYVAAT